nr:MAG TPA: hypothetical protein [Caudoviricetes sp.]
MPYLRFISAINSLNSLTNSSCCSILNKELLKLDSLPSITACAKL